MAHGASRSGAFPIRLLEKPHRVQSRSRRVIQRYLASCALIQLSNSILVALISLYTGTSLTKLEMPDLIKDFLCSFSYDNTIDHNTFLEERVHNFVIFCAKRLLCRADSSRSDSGSNVHALLSRDVFPILNSLNQIIY